MGHLGFHHPLSSPVTITLSITGTNRLHDMAETFQNLMLGFSVALQPSILVYAFVGCVVGTLVGMLPGVGPLAGISMLLPATFGLNPIIAIVLLAGVYYGAMYGGSTTSILMRIPGEAASVMTCIDGYAMTQRGRAGPALAIAAIGSFVAGTLGVVGLMLLAPTLAVFALRFGPPEYTALLLLGFFILAYMSGGSMLKTLAMAAFGLMLGMIGIDVMSGYTRFSFGVVELGDGVGIVPVAVGLFGISEILLTAGQAVAGKVQQADAARAGSLARGVPAFGGADRARQPARLPDRHHPRLGAHHLFVRVLRPRAPAVAAPGALRPGRHRGRGRARVGEQRRGDRRLRADDGAGHSDEPRHRRDDRGDHGARRAARARR